MSAGDGIDSPEAARLAEIPVVECQYRAQRPGGACDMWIIPRCPYCKGRHHHGAGQGLRRAHCAAGAGGTYYLVERS